MAYAQTQKTAKILFIQRGFSRCIKKSQINIKQTNICKLSAAFNENHLRQKRRHDLTAENQPPRVDSVADHAPSMEPLGTTAEHVSAVGTAELEVLSGVSRLAGQMR